jgi:hypothetical protein
MAAKGKAKALRAIKGEETEVYIVGVGEPGVRMPVPLGRMPGGCPDRQKGYMVQAAGEDIGKVMATAVDTASLRGIAAALGGEYIHSKGGGALADRAERELRKERDILGVEYRTAYVDMSERLITAALFMLAAMALIRTP